MISAILKSPYVYSEIVSFVLKKVSSQDLWSNLSARRRTKERNQWNNQYCIQLKKDLKENFTEENVAHFAEVSQVLLQQKESDKQERNNSNQKKGQEQPFHDLFDRAFKVQQQFINTFCSNLEGMERKKQAIKEEIEKNDSYYDVDSISKNSRKR